MNYADPPGPTRPVPAWPAAPPPGHPAATLIGQAPLGQAPSGPHCATCNCRLLPPSPPTPSSLFSRKAAPALLCSPVDTEMTSPGPPEMRPRRGRGVGLGGWGMACPGWERPGGCGLGQRAGGGPSPESCRGETRALFIRGIIGGGGLILKKGSQRSLGQEAVGLRGPGPTACPLGSLGFLVALP